MNKHLTALMILSIAFLVGCAPAQEQSAPEPNPEAEAQEPTPSEPTEEDEPTSATEEVVEINMVAKNWDFIPSTIRVKEGDNVKLLIKGEDDGSGNGHGISIPQFGVSKVIRENDLIEVEFTADKKGTYPFFCSVFCGRGHGSMRGEFIVE